MNPVGIGYMNRLDYEKEVLGKLAVLHPCPSDVGRDSADEMPSHDVDWRSSMAKLTTKARKSLPARDFALPKERKYPVENKAHAANAKSRASEMERKGAISKATEKKIDAKADRKLKNK